LAVASVVVLPKFSSVQFFDLFGELRTELIGLCPNWTRTRTEPGRTGSTRFSSVLEPVRTEELVFKKNKLQKITHSIGSTQFLLHRKVHEELPLLNHLKSWNGTHISRSEVFQTPLLPDGCDGDHQSDRHLKKPVLMPQMSLGQPDNHEQFETE